MYPSQVRYLKKNPVVSFRLKKEEKEKLDKIADLEGKTPGQYVRDFLNGLVEKREKEKEIYDNGFKNGYEKGKKDWQIWYPCNVCGQPIFIKPRSESHKDLARYMKSEGWGHTSCHDQQEEA
jgi:predicted transcriptional regulator